MMHSLLQIYVGEISSSRLRGLFGTVMQLCISVGVLLCYTISIYLPYYHVALAAAAIITAFMVLGAWLCETPRWLLAHGDSQSAFKTLRWLRGTKYDIGTELDTMRSSLLDDDGTGVWREFKKRSITVPFVTLLLVFFFQQIGGLNAQGAYATVIFKNAGVSNPALSSAMAMGISVVVGNVVASALVDKMGRKPLLVISGIGMGVGNTLLGIHFYLTRPSLCSDSDFSGDTGSDEHTSCNTQYGPLAVVSIVVFNFLFSIGWAPVPWILLPELLPLKVRGLGGGMAVLVNWATSALVTGAYLSYSETVTRWFAWWSFALLNFISVGFAIVFLVETKGTRLEVIQAAFKKKWKLKT